MHHLVIRNTLKILDGVLTSSFSQPQQPHCPSNTVIFASYITFHLELVSLPTLQIIVIVSSWCYVTFHLKLVSIPIPQIIIFIPLTLVNLQRNHSETIDCVDQLYNYLRSILSEPIITMVNTLSNKCGANMTLPQNYVVPYKKWSCLLEREYNSVTHMCDSPISPAATGKGL